MFDGPIVITREALPVDPFLGGGRRRAAIRRPRGAQSRARVGAAPPAVTVVTLNLPSSPVPTVYAPVNLYNHECLNALNFD